MKRRELIRILLLNILILGLAASVLSLTDYKQISRGVLLVFSLNLLILLSLATKKAFKGLHKALHQKTGARFFIYMLTLNMAAVYLAMIAMLLTDSVQPGIWFSAYTLAFGFAGFISTAIYKNTAGKGAGKGKALLLAMIMQYTFAALLIFSVALDMINLHWIHNSTISAWISNLRTGFQPSLRILTISAYLAALKLSPQKKNIRFELPAWAKAGLAILIIALFIALKIPYLENSIVESPNYDKFRSYLPNLINAYEYGDPLHNQNNYYNKLGMNDQIDRQQYSEFPFYTWFFYPIMPFADPGNLLKLIRVQMALLDAAIILLLFFLMKKLLGYLPALGSTLIIATNTFFHNYFFVTVMDRPALLFLLLGFLMLQKSRHRPAYLFGGLAILMKESYLSVAIIFYIAHMLMNDRKDWLKRSVQILSLGLAPYLLFQIAIKYAPLLSYPYNYLLLFAGIIIIAGLYILLGRIDYSLLKTESYAVPTIILGIIITAFIGRKALALASNFLPDPSIIFQWKMYYLVLKQTELLFPKMVWLILALGLSGIFFYRQEGKRFYIPLLLSLVSYMVVSSKGVFFHIYYRAFIVLSVVMVIGIFLYSLEKAARNRMVYAALLIIVVGSLSYASFGTYIKDAGTISARDPDDRIMLAAEHLAGIVRPGEMVIGRGSEVINGVILLSGRDAAIFRKAIQKEVKEQGFLAAMERYNVRYYISDGKSDFSDILNLFIDVSKTDNIGRSDLILARISDRYRKMIPDNQIRDIRSDFVRTHKLVDTEEEMKRYRPEQYFRLKDTFEGYYIYEIVSPASASEASVDPEIAPGNTSDIILKAFLPAVPGEVRS